MFFPWMTTDATWSAAIDSAKSLNATVLELLSWLVIDVEQKEDEKYDEKPDEYAFIERVDSLVLHAKGFNIKSV